MSDVKQHEPPILWAWLAQLGFISVAFGPAVLAGLFFGPSVVVGTFLLYAFTCLYVGICVAYFLSKKAKIRIRPMIKSGWTSKYNWNLSHLVLYYILAFLNIMAVFYFTNILLLEWSLQPIIIAINSIFLGYLLGRFGLLLAGSVNGDAEILSKEV